MEIKHKIDREFYSIVGEILEPNLNVEDWRLIESDDEFQSENYSGGFESLEDEFTFSFYNKDGIEFWFQLSLLNLEKIKSGELIEITMRRAK